jgi:hypothetical protein
MYAITQSSLCYHLNVYHELPAARVLVCARTRLGTFLNLDETQLPGHSPRTVLLDLLHSVRLALKSRASQWSNLQVVITNTDKIGTHQILL